jgi:hypothetical protein
MAKKEKTAKQPGQLAQMMRVYKMTAKSDKTSTIWAALAFVGVVAASLLLSVLTAPGNVTNFVLSSIAALVLGVMLAMVVMSRKAERMAYRQIEDQQGAVGAVLSNGLRRNWRGAAMPVAFNAKSGDAVYRAVGPGGIVLIGEGSRHRAQALLEDERKKISRIATGAPITAVFVGKDEGSIRIYEVTKTLYKMKKSLSRAEVAAVDKRLASLGMNIPIPKGIDPRKVRQQRG